MMEKSDLLFCVVLSAIVVLIVTPSLILRARRCIDPATRLDVPLVYLAHGCTALLATSFVSLYLCHPGLTVQAIAAIIAIPVCWSVVLGKITLRLMPQSREEGLIRLEQRLGLYREDYFG